MDTIQVMRLHERTVSIHADIMLSTISTTVPNTHTHTERD
jgi:hypothetical protein